MIQQLHARKGRLVVMCTKGDAASVCVGGSCRIIEVPQVEDCLQPVINIVPLQVYVISVTPSLGYNYLTLVLSLCFLRDWMQLLAYHLTVLRGHNVDQPRNLAKSVTTQ